MPGSLLMMVNVAVELDIIPTELLVKGMILGMRVENALWLVKRFTALFERGKCA
jgi:hypothetical protein